MKGLIIKINKKKFFFFILLFQAGFFSIQAQSILKGKVTDTLNSPLEYANVLAIPQTENNTIAFSICNEKGEYKLTLKNNIPYSIEISYLGFTKISYPITLTENKKKDFLLFPTNESLEEVIIKQRTPVIVKKDTIIYRTDVFTTGEERKLREVLKKLPGVEVDRAGNVTVNGKKVDKFMVDGKPFFTGDTKLGVNNIPADVVDEVEVLDNYTEVAFLKGLSDSDVLALNIKLKEGKKKFVFGDIEAGVGIKERYLINPTLFYYSPKTAINFIGDVNNIGQKSFTFNDYINFEGGFVKLMEDPTGYSNIFNSDFAKYLNNTDYIFNSNQFGAFNISQEITPKTRLTAYSIVNGSTVETRIENQNTYLLNNQITDIENRTTQTDANTFFSLSKLSLNYTPNIDGDLKYDVIIKTSKSNANELLNSQTLIDTNFVSVNIKPTSLAVLQNLKYNKQFSYKHTSTLQATFNINKNNNYKDWLFSEPIFNEIIPIQGETPFNILQKTDVINYNGSLTLKHYWVLNNFNHIYPILGNSYTSQEYSSTDYQSLNNEIIDFNNAGFNNDILFKVNDFFTGFQYKAKAGKFIFKPGLVYHYYNWNVSQFSEEQINASKGVLLPELLVKWDIKNSEKFTIKYKMTSLFSDASFYANRLRLSNFNSLYRGNNSLENSLTHQASLYYYKFNLLKGVFINAGLNYNKKVKSIRNEVILEGINQINTSIYTNLPENFYSVNASFSKKINKIKYILSGNTSFSDYSRIINNNLEDYNSNNTTFTIGAETYFKKLPNLEIGVSQSFSNFSSKDFTNKFSQTNPYVILEYDFLNGFLLNANYRFTYYENKSNNEFNTFQIGNASLFYNKEDSPWGFEIEINNAFDVSFRNENSFNQFIINDSKTFIQPRTIVFKISYKL
ncbi:MAG: hypothetical protein DRI95_15355 [Bacteroidetes bacterium]|nr:MAG: hypothetical protein DRI95_15355 [Bacteroidota bacterium]